MTRSLNISKSSSAAAQSMQTVALSGGLGEVWKVNYPFDNRMSKKILWLCLLTGSSHPYSEIHSSPIVRNDKTGQLTIGELNDYM